MKIRVMNFSICFCFLFLIVTLLFAAPLSEKNYEFISPMPNSLFNTMETTVSIRYHSVLSASDLQLLTINVVGSKSGEISGTLKLAADNRTIIFTPDNKFKPGEKVSIKLKDKNAVHVLPSLEFSFRIAPFDSTPNPYLVVEELKPNFNDKKNNSRNAKNGIQNKSFPTIRVETYDESQLGEGKIFLAVASEVEGVGYYLMILNNDGTPFFSRELLVDYAYDFKVQPNGLYSYGQFIEHHSYTGGGDVIHMIMDNSFSIIDSVQMGNGYVAEAHDFHILPNGNYLLFGYYLVEVDMSKYVENGYPNALVSGGIIQELDSEKNVIFQWRSWDYYDFETYDWGRFAGRPIVSEFHLNTLNLDTDNNLIVCTPTWAKKINRQTGEIIWRLGDFDNEFSFIGVSESDGLDLVSGHAFHRLPNNNFLVYDNGARNGSKTSRVNELVIDEENKTAEPVWSYIPDSTVAGWHRGNAQRLPNGNTVIGWGGSNGNYSPAYTELNSNGEKLLEMFFDPYDVESYRAFRFPIPTGDPSVDAVFIEVAPGNTYDFVDEQNRNTGASVKINSLTGDGYNELRMRKYDYAPINPAFEGKSPIVIPRKILFTEFGLQGIDADLRIDPSDWEIADPENLIVYHRDTFGTGIFSALPTVYNHVIEKIVAQTTSFGEYILAKPDYDAVVFTPMLTFPEDYGDVNGELQVVLEWNPVGYVTGFNIEISDDVNFGNIIESAGNYKQAVYSFSSVESNSKYYWRVQSINEAGTSEWSVRSFNTIDPFISLTSPNGTEHVQIGLEIFIRWDDNIEEDVILSLLKNDSEYLIIDTVESRTAFLWDVPLDIELGDNYKIKITSLINEELFDISSTDFSIVDSTTSVGNDKINPGQFYLFQNFPNPFNPSTIISYQIPNEGFVTLDVFDVVGRKTVSLVNNFQRSDTYKVRFNAQQLASGIYFYRLSVNGKVIDSKKMLLMK